MAKQHSVLVVDDDNSVRSLYVDALGEAGHMVAVAVDGADALERLRGDAVPCMVLTDVRMPRSRSSASAPWTATATMWPASPSAST